MRRPPKKPEDLAPEEARASALRILGRREHSADQLKRKLSQRGHRGERVDAVVDQLAESGWQSDVRYAEALARSRAAQGYGPLRIRAELSGAGVSDAEARAAIEALDVDFGEAAKKAYARHFRDPPAGAAERQKHYRYLAGRGFATEHIRAAMKGGEEEV